MSSKLFCSKIEDKSMECYIDEWKADITSSLGSSGNGKNELRTYKLFKSEFKTEYYVSATLPIKHRTVLAKLRCSVAPLRLETRRYENIPIVNIVN